MMVGETSYHFDMSEYHVISKKQDQKNETPTFQVDAHRLIWSILTGRCTDKLRREQSTPRPGQYEIPGIVFPSLRSPDYFARHRVI